MGVCMVCVVCSRRRGEGLGGGGWIGVMCVSVVGLACVCVRVSEAIGINLVGKWDRLVRVDNVIVQMRN